MQTNIVTANIKSKTGCSIIRTGEFEVCVKPSKYFYILITQKMNFYNIT